ncbi:hypothetical protein EP867_04425 [Falsigemmobacter intermedius]|uniref:Uncharacterized protein n=2 Tax=Falsigemmobacter intermedius TaxID=1553448 RepID=A0A3S3UCP1_9RHOB|nr:hypothetical protein [Falsigemmobacter intermedius]RWY43653.1 hypothetical protein EP867_04425 [Falsigemmobacter intermedius]
MKMNDDPLARARALAVRHKAELFIKAGPMLDNAEMLGRFGLTPERLAEMRENAEVLALERGDVWFYPAFQFKEDGSLIYRLAEYLDIFRLDSPWALLDLILVGTELHGMDIVDAMRARRDDILDRELAQEQGDGFA